MMPGIDIDDLAAMSPLELRATWREQFRKPAPDIGPGLLRPGIAWRLQSRLHGGLPSSTRKGIEKASRRLEQTGSVRSPHDIAIKPGTRLVREWNGRTYHVLVLEDGFEYCGRRYASLSQIARDITGAHWSGPRFFGLKNGKAGAKKASSDG